MLPNSSFVTLTVTVLTLITVAVAYVIRAFTYWYRKGVPHPPISVPFGSIKSSFLQKITIGEELRRIYEEYRRKGLRYAGIYLFTRPVLVVLDLELVKSIMSTDFQYFTDHEPFDPNPEIDVLNAHLFNMKGDKWKQLRTKVTPAFSSGKIKMMFQTFVNYADKLIPIMNEMADRTEPVDIKSVLSRLTIDVIGSCTLGIECNSLKDQDTEFKKYIDLYMTLDKKSLIKHLLLKSFPALMEHFKIKITNEEVSRFYSNIINETVRYREENNIVRKDLIHLLIQLKNGIAIDDTDETGNLNSETNYKSETQITELELTAVAFGVFLGGLETSASALTFCMYELTINLEIQAKLRKEIKSVLKRHDGKITYDAVIEMTYMDRCLDETLRKYPPVTILQRICGKNYKIPDSDLVIEKGTLVYLPIYGIHYDPEYYPDPEEFCPDRFLPENKLRHDNFAWLPFGEGPRICLGLRFGLIEAKAVLALLLDNYEFTLNSKTETPIVIDPGRALMSTKGDIWLNCRRWSDTVQT